MSLSDIGEGIGSAVSSGVSGIATAGSSALDFAKGIAAKAVDFVEDRAQSAAGKVFQGVSGVAQGAANLIPKVAQGIGGALADPSSFVAGLVESAKAKASSALGMAEGVVGNLAHAALTGVKGVFGLAAGGAQLLARSLAAGVGVVAKGIATGFAGSLRLITNGALLALRMGVKGSKVILTLAAKAALNTVRGLQRLLIGLTARATTTMLVATSKAFDFGRQRLIAVAGKAKKAADLVVLKAVPRVTSAIGNVAVKAKQIADATQQGGANIANKLLALGLNRTPGGQAILGALLAPLNAVSNFTRGIANKAGRLQGFFIGKVTPAALVAHAAFTANLQPMLARAFLASAMLERQVAASIGNVGLGAMNLLQRVGGILERRIQALDRNVTGLIDSGLGMAETGANTVVDLATKGALTIAQKVGDAAIAGEQTGEEIASGQFGGIGKALNPLPILKTVGNVIGKVGTAAAAIAGRVVSGAAQAAGDGITTITRPFRKKTPHDGELTGPFYPQKKEDPGPSAEARQSEFDESTRRAEIRQGAHIFVNGIDTTLEDHYAAAQRLANELGRPVVGIYNATGGKGRDLLQCAADKLFDRGENPAIKTLTGILVEQGHKPGKEQNKIYAHSQGSLIVSEALRQAGKGGANLQQYEVTTFGNAAWTFPKGPKYHHYVHDDDLVPALAGTSSRMSYMMNQTRIGRWLSEKMLGQMSDAQKDTTVLHHGGKFIDPHSLNVRNADGTANKAEQAKDYIGHLKTFQAEEKKTATRGPRQAKIQTSVGFSVARGLGSMVSDGVAGGYAKLDSALRATTSMMPGGVASTLWSGMSRRLVGLGHSIQTAGAGLGVMNDSYFYSRTQMQRPGAMSSGYASGGMIQRQPGSDVASESADAVQARLDKSGESGFAPSTQLREELAPHLGFDPAFARIHVGPEAGQASQALGAEAFTIGRDVYFAPGQYDPASQSGKALLAHELTHVAQQHGLVTSQIQRSLPSGASRDSMETEAQTIASGVLNDLGVGRGLHVQRLEKVYQAEEGFGREDELRLDRICQMAIRKAQDMVGSKTGQIENLNITVEIDLARMGDEDAASVWAEAIVAQIHLSPVQSAPTPAAPSLIQKVEAPPTPPTRLPLSQDIQRIIEQDVEVITAELKKWSPDHSVILGILHRWRMMDIDTAGRYDRDTRHMDYLFTRLQIRTYDKGIVSSNWVNALDELFREFHGAGPEADALRRYQQNTAAHKAYRPEAEQEGVGSYVARHTLMGALGILKALGGAIMGLAQAGVWAQWRLYANQRKAMAFTLQKASDWFGADLKEQIEFFRSDGPPKADDFVAQHFDQTAKIVIGWMGDLPEEEKKKLFEEFNFGNKWGAIPANLMMLGAGGGGLTSKGAQWLFRGAMILSSAKAIEDSSVALGKRIDEIHKQRPNASWWDVLSDGEVLKQMTMIVVSAISLGSSYAEAANKSKEVIGFLSKLGYAGDWAQLGPILKTAWDHYHDPALSDEARKDKLEQDAIDFINQVINIGNSTKQRREQAAAEQKVAAEKAQAAEIERQKQVALDEHKAEVGPVPITPEQKQAEIDAAYRQRQAELDAKPKTFEETLTPEQKAARDKYFADQRGETRAPTPEELKKNPNLISREVERKASYEGETKKAAPEEAAPKPEPKKELTDAQRQTALEQLAKDKETLKDPGIDAEYRKKLEKRVRKNETKLADEHAKPAVAAESRQNMEVIARGGEDAKAAAIEMIKREQGWKSKLREAVSEKGAFKDVEGGASKEKVAAIGKVFDEARAQIVNEAAQKVLTANPHLAELIGTQPSGQAHRAGLFEAGTPGFKSDRDITARPKQEHIDALAKFDERAAAAKTPDEKAAIMREKAQRVADLVAASGEVVRLMNEELAKSTGGIPDKTLDTNMYSWTGSEIKFDIPASEAKKVNQGTDIASLTELKQRMTPEDWAKHKQQLIEGTGDYREIGGEQMRERILDQIKQAEQTSQNLNDRTTKEIERLQKEKPNESKQALEMEAKANVAFELNKKVVELMRQNPVPYGEIANLQSQIKILEPGAYGSQAGIKDVVLTQQPMSRDYDNYVAAQEALQKMQSEGKATPEQLAEAHRKVREAEDAARNRYLKGEELTPREMAQSAASTLAQLEDHNPAKHPPTTETEALTAIKDAYKYAGRIAYLEYLMTGQRVELPDVANYSRGQLQEMVQQWARETGRNPETPITQLALEYSQARIEKLREMTNRLKLESMYADTKAPVDKQTPEAKQAAQGDAKTAVSDQQTAIGPKKNEQKSPTMTPRPVRKDEDEDKKDQR